MKNSRLIPLCLAVATLLIAPVAQAQRGGPPSPVATSATLSPPPVTKSTLSFKLPAGKLTEAVKELVQMFEQANQGDMNVIYSPEVQAVSVPELNLRNVSGPDALRLITVAAGCDLEPIIGNDGQPIGYRISSVNLPPPGSYRYPERAPGANPTTEAQPIQGSVGETAGIPAGAPSAFPGTSVGAPPLAGGIPGAGGMPGGVVGFSGDQGSTKHVRVYGLGTITTTVKFDELEATLHDVLKAAGVSGEAAKLAFHDRTNVLVVTGEQQVHNLVGEYLEALQKNAAAAAADERRMGGDRKQLIEAEVRMQAFENERARLEKQLEAMQARLQETQQELDRARASAPKGQ